MAGLHLHALQSHFLEQSFHAFGQKKNETIPLARSNVAVEISSARYILYDVIIFPSKKDWSQKVQIAARES